MLHHNVYKYFQSDFHQHINIYPIVLTQQKENMDDFEADDGGKGGKSSGRRKPAYAGGLVLDPKKGETL